jgi:hypothetical protein
MEKEAQAASKARNRLRPRHHGLANQWVNLREGEGEEVPRFRQKVLRETLRKALCLEL